jgi:hypothetical protein
LIDDGNKDRGHRRNIFDPDVKIIGVGVADHKTRGQTIVIDYAGGITEINAEKRSKKKADIEKKTLGNKHEESKVVHGKSGLKKTLPSKTTTEARKKGWCIFKRFSHLMCYLMKIVIFRLYSSTKWIFKDGKE